MRLAIPAAALALLCACAGAPTYTTADDRALDPVRQKYQECLKSQTRAVVRGSDDVQFLVHYVITQCDGELDGVTRYLRTRGFSPEFIHSYLEDVRQEANTVLSGVILRIKAEDAQKHG